MLPYYVIYGLISLLQYWIHVPVTHVEMVVSVTKYLVRSLSVAVLLALLALSVKQVHNSLCSQSFL